MTALEIAIGATSILTLAVIIFASTVPGPWRRGAGIITLAATIGAIWFIARLWGFA